MEETDLAYYGRRYAQEVRLSANAITPEAAAAHRMLALNYAREIRGLGTCVERPTLVVANPPALLRAAG